MTSGLFFKFISSYEHFDLDILHLSLYTFVLLWHRSQTWLEVTICLIRQTELWNVDILTKTCNHEVNDLKIKSNKYYICMHSPISSYHFFGAIKLQITIQVLCTLYTVQIIMRNPVQSIRQRFFKCQPCMTYFRSNH